MKKKKFKLKPFNKKGFDAAVKASDLEAKGIKTGHFTKIASPKEVRAMRRSVNMSQTELARALGSSPSRIQSWEQGKRFPDGLTSKLIRVLTKQPSLIKALQEA